MIFYVLATDNFYQTLLVIHCFYSLQISFVMNKPVYIKLEMFQSVALCD